MLCKISQLPNYFDSITIVPKLLNGRFCCIYIPVSIPSRDSTSFQRLEDVLYMPGLPFPLCFPAFTRVLLEIQMIGLDDKLIVINVNNQKSYIFPNQNKMQNVLTHFLLIPIFQFCSQIAMYKRSLKGVYWKKYVKTFYLTVLFRKMYGLWLFIFIVKLYFNVCLLRNQCYSIIFQRKMLNP